MARGICSYAATASMWVGSGHMSCSPSTRSHTPRSTPTSSAVLVASGSTISSTSTPTAAPEATLSNQEAPGTPNSSRRRRASGWFSPRGVLPTEMMHSLGERPSFTTASAASALLACKSSWASPVPSMSFLLGAHSVGSRRGTRSRPSSCAPTPSIFSSHWLASAQSAGSITPSMPSPAEVRFTYAQLSRIDAATASSALPKWSMSVGWRLSTAAAASSGDPMARRHPSNVADMNRCMPSRRASSASALLVVKSTCA
mmetsp:Transcript_5150/g.10890  ORF Transcript_5150/g.10890 Transcript_5150/m.10890 type:complete len:257 (-) Transcript_5150:676-1446(-)